MSRPTADDRCGGVDVSDNLRRPRPGTHMRSRLVCESRGGAKGGVDSGKPRTETGGYQGQGEEKDVHNHSYKCLVVPHRRRVNLQIPSRLGCPSTVPLTPKKLTTPSTLRTETGEHPYYDSRVLLFARRTPPETSVRAGSRETIHKRVHRPRRILDPNERRFRPR